MLKVQRERERELIAETLATFINLRQNHIDEIPPNILLPDDLNYDKYKCRVGFFTTIMAWLDVLRNDGIINEPVAIQEVDNFFQYVRVKMDKQDRTFPEDIIEVNRVLDYFIAYLENRLK